MPLTRRELLQRAGLAVGGALITGLPRGASSALPTEADLMAHKDGLVLLNDRPLNAETPPWLMDEAFTRNARHFVRNNGRVPERALRGDPTGWTLTVDGEVERPLTLDLAALKRYPRIERAVVIECGGNGRAGFRPGAKGNQWTIGGVGCARWAGARLKDILADAGVKPSAVYLGYYGEDTHLSGDPDKVPISRGIPIAKAQDDVLVAYEMNGGPIPALHGFPVRLVVPGWPASTSGKWLKRLWIRDRVHDGPKMEAPSYRLPRHPVAPGEAVAPEDMVIMGRMPVKSVITHPRSGHRLRPGEALEIRGHAWSGERHITAVDLSLDFGATWIPCQLDPAANPDAWQRWRADIRLPSPGHFELWARATDSAGEQQPMVVPGWNPKGYNNNAMHRVALKGIG